MKIGADDGDVGPNLWWWIALGVSGLFAIVLILSLLTAWCCVYHPCDAEYYTRRLAWERRRKRREKRLRERERLRKLNGGIGRFPKRTAAPLNGQPQQSAGGGAVARQGSTDTEEPEVSVPIDDDSSRVFGARGAHSGQPPVLGEAETTAEKTVAEGREVSPSTSDESNPQRRLTAHIAPEGVSGNPLALSATEVSHRSASLRNSSVQKTGSSSSKRLPQRRSSSTASGSIGTYQNDGLSSTFRELDGIPGRGISAQSSEAVVRKTVPLPLQSTQQRDQSPTRPASSASGNRYGGVGLASRPAARTASGTRLTQPLSGSTNGNRAAAGHHHPPSPKSSALVKDSQISPRRAEARRDESVDGGSRVHRDNVPSLTLRRVASLGSNSALLPDGTRLSRQRSRTNSHVTFLDHVPLNDGMLVDTHERGNPRHSTDPSLPQMPPVVEESMPPFLADQGRRGSSPALTLGGPGGASSSASRTAHPPREQRRLPRQTPTPTGPPPSASSYYTFASPAPMTRRESSPDDLAETEAPRARSPPHERGTHIGSTAPSAPGATATATSGNDETTASSMRNSLASTQTPPAGPTHTFVTQSSNDDSNLLATPPRGGDDVPLHSHKTTPDTVTRSRRSHAPDPHRDALAGLVNRAGSAPRTARSATNVSSGGDILARNRSRVERDLTPTRDGARPPPAALLNSPLSPEGENASVVSEADTIPAAPIVRESLNSAVPPGYVGAAHTASDRGLSSPRRVTPSPPAVGAPSTPTPRQRSAERDGVMSLPPPPVVMGSAIVDARVTPRTATAAPLEAPNSSRSRSRRDRSPPHSQQRRASEPAAAGPATVSPGATLTAAALANHRKRSSSSSIRVLKITSAPAVADGGTEGSSATQHTQQDDLPQPEATFNALGAPLADNSRSSRQGADRPPLSHHSHLATTAAPPATASTPPARDQLAAAAVQRERRGSGSSTTNSLLRQYNAATAAARRSASRSISPGMPSHTLPPSGGHAARS